MCIFEEKLDEQILEKLQDFEFSVCCRFTCAAFYRTCDRDYLIIYHVYVLCNAQFSDGDGDSKKFFYRTAKTRELDDLLGDIYHKILGMHTNINFFISPDLKKMSVTRDFVVSQQQMWV